MRDLSLSVQAFKSGSPTLRSILVLLLTSLAQPPLRGIEFKVLFGEVGMTIWINDGLPESWLCQDKLGLKIVPTTIEEIRTNCFKDDLQGEECPIILTATVIMGNSSICDAFARVIWRGELATPKIPPSQIWYDPPASGDVAFLGIGDISNRVLVNYCDFPQATWLKVTFFALTQDEVY
jgi:hypothetical protein